MFSMFVSCLRARLTVLFWTVIQYPLYFARKRTIRGETMIVCRKNANYVMIVYRLGPGKLFDLSTKTSINR